ncbi:hypothetical protein VU06_00750 [Desulfobulbus sp. F3]|nr:hypothetical protein [Desulfobulbus sp. F3]
MAAQILTAFYLLRKNRWLLATCFLAFALGVKVNAMLFFPAFFLCLMVWTARRHRPAAAAAIFCSCLLLISLCAWGLGEAISSRTGAAFYPVMKFHETVRMVERKIWPEETQPQAALPLNKDSSSAPQKKAKVISENKASIIANHPGDLRNKVNYVIYGGLLLWLLALIGTAGTFLRLLNRRSHQQMRGGSSCWLWGTGLSYLFAAAFFLASAPDARFFLPGLPFLLLPLAEQAVCLPRPKWLISLLTSLALLQGGYVLAKTYNLRQVSPALQEAIAWLQKNPPMPPKVFMYPEGNYRLFSVPHEWYLKYHLREFWRADNDLRLEILRRFGIGAVVIKKHLIAPVDEQITDLGVYPDYFVKDIRNDERFFKIFENSAVIIFQIPAMANLPLQKTSEQKEGVMQQQ